MSSRKSCPPGKRNKHDHPTMFIGAPAPSKNFDTYAIIDGILFFEFGSLEAMVGARNMRTCNGSTQTTTQSDDIGKALTQTSQTTQTDASSRTDASMNTNGEDQHSYERSDPAPAGRPCICIPNPASRHSTPSQFLSTRKRRTLSGPWRESFCKERPAASRYETHAELPKRQRRISSDQIEVLDSISDHGNDDIFSQSSSSSNDNSLNDGGNRSIFSIDCVKSGDKRYPASGQK